MDSQGFIYDLLSEVLNANLTKWSSKKSLLPITCLIYHSTICTSLRPSLVDSQRLRVSAALTRALASALWRGKGAGGEGGRSARCYQSITDPSGQSRLLSFSLWPSCSQCTAISLRSTYGHLDKNTLVRCQEVLFSLTGLCA